MTLNWSVRTRWLLAALLVLGLVVAVAVLRPRAKAVAVVTVQRADLSQSVIATGRINLPERVELASEVTATVTAVHAREGERVRQGQLLIQLADAEARAALAQAQSSLREAQARLLQQQDVAAAQAQSALAQAQATLRVAEAEWRRTSELVAQGFFSQQKLDDTRRALELARSALQAAQAQAQAQRPDGVETTLSRARIAQADAAQRSAQARLARLTLTAPFDAIVLARHADPGALAQPGKTLLSLGSAQGLRIDAAIDERHLGLLAPGLTARAVADAYPDRPFPAQLSWVSPAVDAARGTVDVRLSIPEPVPDFLRPDMTVSVDMRVGSAQGVLTLDAAAVRDADSASPWALVVREGIAHKVPLTLGLRGVGAIEVRSGLSEGEAVIPATEKAIPGDRVRPAPAKATPLATGGGMGR